MHITSKSPWPKNQQKLKIFAPTVFTLFDMGCNEVLLHFLSEFFKPLLCRSRSQGRCCWAAIRLSHRPEPSGRVVHVMVDGLDIGGQHGRRFVFLRHTNRRQRRPYPICARRSWNVRHQYGGGYADPHRSWEGHSNGGRMPVSGMKVRSLVGLSAHSAFRWCSAHYAPHPVVCLRGGERPFKTTHHHLQWANKESFKTTSTVYLKNCGLKFLPKSSEKTISSKSK